MWRYGGGLPRPPYNGRLHCLWATSVPQVGLEDEWTVQLACSNVGICCDGSGKKEEAIVWYKKCIKIREAAVPANDDNLDDNYYDLGNAYYAIGNIDEAIYWLEKSRKIRTEKKYINPSKYDLVLQSLSDCISKKLII